MVASMPRLPTRLAPFPAPFLLPTTGPLGTGKSIGRRGLGGIGGVELEPGLEVADPALQFRDPSLEGVHQGQDGGLSLRRDGIPERSGDGRLRDHANNTTGPLYKLFGP